MIGFLNYGARFAMTLSLDGLLPAKASAVHSRYHLPHIAIGILAVTGFLTMSSMVLFFRHGDNCLQLRRHSLRLRLDPPIPC